jgi:hypothetical protein
MVNKPTARKQHTGRFYDILTLGSSNCSCLGPVSYLSGLRDLKNVGLVNVCMAKLCLKSNVLKMLLTSNFTKIVESYGMQFQEFSDVLSSTNSVVAGSVALRCVTGETYSSIHGCCEGDLDIYVHEGLQGQIQVTEYLKTLNYFDLLNPVRNSGSGYKPGNMSEVRTFFSTRYGRCIDVVIMKHGCAPKTSVCHYDLSFLMSFFDGVKFVILFPTHILESKGYYNQVQAFFLLVNLCHCALHPNIGVPHRAV